MYETCIETRNLHGNLIILTKYAYANIIYTLRNKIIIFKSYRFPYQSLGNYFLRIFYHSNRLFIYIILLFLFQPRARSRRFQGCKTNLNTARFVGSLSELKRFTCFITVGRGVGRNDTTSAANVRAPAPRGNLLHTCRRATTILS